MTPAASGHVKFGDSSFDATKHSFRWFHLRDNMCLITEILIRPLTPVSDKYRNRGMPQWRGRSPQKRFQFKFQQNILQFEKSQIVYGGT
jgi:hypothetical protein